MPLTKLTTNHLINLLCYTVCLSLFMYIQIKGYDNINIEKIMMQAEEKGFHYESNLVRSQILWVACLQAVDVVVATKHISDTILNEGVVSKETVVLRRWGSSIQKFGFINRVDNVNWPPYRDSVRWPIYIINSVDKTKFFFRHYIGRAWDMSGPCERS